MKKLVAAVIVVIASLIWLYLATEKPLSPRELWTLEQSEENLR